MAGMSAVAVVVITVVRSRYRGDKTWASGGGSYNTGSNTVNISSSDGTDANAGHGRVMITKLDSSGVGHS